MISLGVAYEINVEIWNYFPNIQNCWFMIGSF